MVSRSSRRSRSCSRSSTSSRPTRAGPPRRSCSASLGGPGKVVPNNTHFDTTRANVEFTGAEAVDLVIAEGRDPRADPPVQGQHGRRRARRAARASAATDVPVVFVTITNNSRRRPAGLARPTCARVREVCDRHGMPLFLDACRFAENAWFIKQREPGQARPRDRRHRARDGVARRRHDDERQEGRPGQHRRLAGDERRRARRAVPQPADPDRGLPDLRRPRRPRPRGDRPGPARGRRRGLPALPDPLDRLPRRGAATRPACRSCSRSAATRSTSTPGRCCRTSRRSSTPARRSRSRCTARAGIRGCEIGTVMFGRQPGRHRDAGRDGPRAPGDPAPDLHPEPHRLRDRGRAARSPRAPASCAATGSSTSRRPLRHFTARFEPV